MKKEIEEKIIYDDDTTKYEDFITSYFAWVPMDKQRKIVDRLEDIAKK